MVSQTIDSNDPLQLMLKTFLKTKQVLISCLEAGLFDAYLFVTFYLSVCMCYYFHQDCGDEEKHSAAVRQYEAGLESSYKEQCALALEDKKTVLKKIINEKENGERERCIPHYMSILLHLFT